FRFLSFFYQRYCALRALHSFPTRRSSDLARSCAKGSAYRSDSLQARCKLGTLPPDHGEVASSHLQCNRHTSALRGSQSQGRTHRSEEHTSELQSPYDLVCRLLLEKKKKKK